MEFKRVVVTGLGTINPLGNSIETFWDGLQNGVSGAAPIKRFDASGHKTQFACEVKGFDPEIYVEKKEVRKHDPYTLFAFAAVAQAMEDSGLNLEAMNKDRAGVIWGAGIGGLQTFYEEAQSFDPEKPRFSPFFIPKMIANIAGGLISIRYGFRGPNFTTVTACASASHAIIEAMNYIRMGKADVFITGGSEAAVNPAGVSGFNSMRALSTRNDDPKTASRPFDLDRDGFVIGEGSGALIIEEYEHALKRGAKIYAELAGGGMSADAYHMTAPDPEGGGATLVMKWALEDAGMNPEDVDYINVHGTSTPLGDVAEPQAIVRCFGDHAKKLSISSTKSMTGHLLGAAGAVEAIASICALNYGIIPPTINHFTDDPAIIPLDYTFNVAKKRDIKVAMSNTFGFGGHNATVIIKKL
ncbi:MAG: beta-ketoacyl-[acyl-carrier-protein] synthase II [Bacteroidetes bacterium GWF2_42_66]|nr:MAG: beta-ketoacyl-[acyl-carrier-protein] synthase II [Bacteroidetes bacterium GWA2_42_15]OFY00765.1 MAG: beta-ketoacyl-[acyl-carrier-protein] synthase II [Bacteroidetes bacterium GWE2_42_39]OFY40790.1 MAG: beta-ketoacyl-[acyl-carrier-protein] synthase II [Bacteroidetes bacterium GWF2_42_66]HBL75805.1 beta-ketoacyl-[acyl-carrier-protein] synthase II [Prolixibacteraceae bacterium]HCR91585.1 beta-ketoacyl-[acyl-carrier-protein] synthase II [Prolixibacteraceae bacterium]